MIVLKVKFILFFLLILFITESVFAKSTYSEKTIEDGWRVFHDAGMRTWQRRLLPEFKKNADQETRKILDKVSFHIVKFADFNAFADQKNKRIIIPVGLIVIIHNIADAAILTWAKPQCANKFRDYPLTLAEVYSEKFSGKSNPVLPDFANICGISQKEADSIRKNDDLYNFKATIIVDSLAFIVGHEIGHLVLGHRSSLALSVQEAHNQEYDADAFGMELATKSGFLPGFAVSTVFPMFAILESEVGESGGDKHPPVSCRTYRNLMSISDIFSAESSIDGMKRMGTTPEKFQRDMAELRSSCEKAIESSQ